MNKSPGLSPRAFIFWRHGLSKVTRLFILSGLIYLCIGVTIGVLFTVFPDAIGRLLAMHAHTNLLGWVSIMIFGVSYHVLPRFSGRPLYSERLAGLHFILSNTGLIGLIISWPLSKTYYGGAPLPFLFTGSALLYAIAAYLFVYNLGKTVFGKA